MYLHLVQFTAIMLMVILTLKLLVLPPRILSDSMVNRSRWLLVAGSVLLGIQFLLQYIFGLRENNIKLALTVNVAFFIPCAAFYSLAVINLQCKGYLGRLERYIGIPVWLLAIAVSTWSVIAASFLYAALQIFYFVRQMRNMAKIHHAVANYYDSDIDDLLHWMEWSIYLMAMMAVTVPLMIFVRGPLLAVFAIIFLLGIFYLVDNFTFYAVSNAPAKVEEAQQNEEDVLSEEAVGLQRQREEHPSETLDRVGLAIDKWTERFGYLQQGLNLPVAAEAIGVPRYLLSAWLKQRGVRYNDWLTSLRIEEAKKVLRAHPEWSNESIAQHCGFSDRTYFQRKFKQLTGLTPSDFMMQ